MNLVCVHLSGVWESEGELGMLLFEFGALCNYM